MKINTCTYLKYQYILSKYRTLKIGILHSTHLNKNFVLEIQIRQGMVRIKNQERTQTSFHVASLGHHDSAARSDLCYQLQQGVVKLRRQNQENRIGKRMEIKMEPRLLQKKSWNERYQKTQGMDPKRENDRFQMDSISSCESYMYIAV